ncbi:MAG TPA: TetR/AcrR family transcriptional regulator [Nevskiaceae bacterium]|nr:TetR/AcrR family transcriptional regulator [Nevskiaceae bacterium]
MAERAPKAAGDRPASAIRGEDTRTALLTTALEAFASVGYQAMSVRELTRSLDVSHNIVHHHFKSKRDLWRMALDYGMADARREIVQMYEAAAVDVGADPEEAVRQMVKAAVQLFARYPSLARIIAHESAQGGERLDVLFEDYIGPTAKALQHFLQSLHKTKNLRKIDPHFVTLFIISGVSSLFTHSSLAAKLGVQDAKSEAVVNAYADAVAELVAHGLVEPA